MLLLRLATRLFTDKVFAFACSRCGGDDNDDDGCCGCPIVIWLCVCLVTTHSELPAMVDESELRLRAASGCLRACNGSSSCSTDDVARQSSVKAVN